MPRHELKIMEEFSIREISAVDKPAQEHALATIMKRAPQANEVSPAKSIDELKAGVADLATRFDALLEQKAQKEVVMNFNDAVTEIAKRDACPRHVAMSKARNEYPESFAKYQSEGLEKSRTATKAEDDDADIRKASRDFNDAVRMLMTSGTSRTQAMQEARRRMPDEFRRAYRR